MNFVEYLEKYNAQKKINKLVKRYKNKKIVLYGTGEFAKIIFEKYDLSKLNIIAISGMNSEEKQNQDFFGFRYINSKELGTIDCDVILISDFDYKKSLMMLDDHLLYQSKNENIEVRPLIKLSFFDILKS